MFSLSLLPLKCVQWIFDAWHNYIHINKYQGIRKLIADWLPTARQTQQKRESKREQKLRFCWLSNATSYKFIIPSNLYYILTVYAVHSIERYWLCMKSKRDKWNVSRSALYGKEFFSQHFSMPISFAISDEFKQHLLFIP